MIHLKRQDFEELDHIFRIKISWSNTYGFAVERIRLHGTTEKCETESSSD